MKKKKYLQQRLGWSPTPKIKLKKLPHATSMIRKEERRYLQVKYFQKLVSYFAYFNVCLLK